MAADTDGGSLDLYERAGTTTTMLSVGSAGQTTAGIGFDGNSADGTRVFFNTFAQLTPGDIDSQMDTYQRQGSTTTLITDGPGEAWAFSQFVGASTDGTRVFFRTDGKLTSGDTDAGAFDIYERSAGATTHAVDGADRGRRAASSATFRSASSDGSRVFLETAEQLVAEDNDSQHDVYERAGTTTRLVSKGTSGRGHGPARDHDRLRPLGIDVRHDAHVHLQHGRAGRPGAGSSAASTRRPSAPAAARATPTRRGR